MERITNYHRTKALACTLLLLALSSARAQAQFYYLGQEYLPTDVSSDGSIVVGTIETVPGVGSGAYFVEGGTYFAWDSDRRASTSSDPRDWVLPIAGGTYGGGGSIGGSPSVSDDGRFVSGTAFHYLPDSEYPSADPNTEDDNYYSFMSLLDRDTVEYEFDPSSNEVTSFTANWTNLGGFGKELDDDFSVGWSISGNGQHVVGMAYREPGIRGADAVIWNAGDTELTALGRTFTPPLTGDYSENDKTAVAKAVSEDGSVVVGWQLGPPPAPSRNGMIWVDGVPTKRFMHSGEATAVSADGTWVVGMDHAYGQPGDFNGDYTVDLADYVVWRNNIGLPAVSLLNDIDGGTVGDEQYETWKAHFGETEPERTRDAWRWSEETGLEPLGRMTEGSQSGLATVVNADGTIILGGDSFFGQRPGTGGGWIWQEGVGFTSLNTYFESFGFDVTGYNFGLPTAMSADGLTIVGRGYDINDGYESGWVVTLPASGAATFTTTVPEPAAGVVMLVASVLALLGLKRQRCYARLPINTRDNR